MATIDESLCKKSKTHFRPHVALCISLLNKEWLDEFVMHTLLWRRNDKTKCYGQMKMSKLICFAVEKFKFFKWTLTLISVTCELSQRQKSTKNSFWESWESETKKCQKRKVLDYGILWKSFTPTNVAKRCQKVKIRSAREFKRSLTCLAH